MAKSLWNIGTPQNPVIQGQDGLPFYHEPGGWRKFEKSSNSYEYVNNNCLCKCRNYLYYVNYIHLGSQQRKVFASDSHGNINYNKYEDLTGRTFNQSKLMCIPAYLPAGTYTTGVSQIPDLPYSDLREDNTTWPCPQYYRQDSPFGPATTIRRYINTYKSSDCGVPVKSDSSGSGSGSGSGNCQWYWSQFYVEDLNYPDVDPYAERIEGSQGHSKGLPPPTKSQILDCHTARVLVSMKSCSDAFDYSNSYLNTAAIAAVSDQIKCVYWTLYKASISCCDSNSSPVQWVIVHQETAPEDIWGQGDGEGPEDMHDKEQHIKKTGASAQIYQWVSSASYPGPVPGSITGNPCNEICSRNYGPTSDSGSGAAGISADSYIECSDSKSCSGCPESRPCNIRKEFPYFYKAAEVQYPLFDIWRKYPSNSWSIIQQALRDWQLVPKWDGKWTYVKLNSNSQIEYIDILIDTLDENSDGSLPAKIQQERMRQIWDQEDAEDFYLNHFTYWQFYFQCDTQYGVCGQPRVIEETILQQQWQEIAQQHMVCLNKWQLANRNNTFTPQDQPVPGLFVYTLETPSDIFKICYELRKGASSITIHGNGKYSGELSKTIQLPKKYLQMQITTIQPGQILREDPLYIASQVSNQTLLLSTKYSSNSISNLKCTFQPIYQGWYQEPRGVQGEQELDTTHWKSAYPSQKLVTAHYQNGILTPGRKAAEQGQQGEAICRLYNIMVKSYGWMNAVGQDQVCSNSRYILWETGQPGEPEQITVPQYINWQRKCAKPTPYGLKVYVIGPAVFPGIQFQSVHLPQEITGLQSPYKVSGELLIDLHQSNSASWVAKHGSNTIASGFYTLNQSLPMSWYSSNQTVVFPTNRTLVDLGISPSRCVTWSIDTKIKCPRTLYDTMAWRIYIAFGKLNGLNQVVGVRGINGQNGTCNRKVGFSLQFYQNVVCAPDSFGKAYKLYDSSTGRAVRDYFYNKSPSIQIAADQKQYVWPGDSNSASISIPIGFLVPDPRGVSVFGNKLSTRGVVTGSNYYYYWSQSIMGQSYGSDKKPWWVANLNDIQAFKSVSSNTCTIFSEVYIPVQEKELNPRQQSSKYRHARLSSTMTTAGTSYIRSRLRSSGALGDDGIHQIYAPQYMIKGNYDDSDAVYAGYDIGEGVYTLKCTRLRKKNSNTSTRTDTWDLSFGTSGYDYYLPGTKLGTHTYRRTGDYADYGRSDSRSISEDYTGGSLKIFGSHDCGEVPKLIRGTSCQSLEYCNNRWYLCFDTFPHIVRFGGWSQVIPSAREDCESVIYLCNFITNVQTCNGRKRFALPNSFGNTEQERTISFSLQIPSSQYNYSDTQQSIKVSVNRGSSTYTGVAIIRSTLPTSWFPRGNSGLS